MNEPTPSAPKPLLLRLMPGLGLVGTYQRQWLGPDVLAGLSVCIIMIPSVIAYAGLMGLPPQHGLYAALVPLIIYPLFGSSRQVIVGPDIAISLLIASTILPVTAGDPAGAARLAALLALLTGILLLLGAAARFGAVADFLSRPVLVGYLSGAALILIASQLDKFTGLALKRAEFFPRLIELAANASQVHPTTLVLGIALLSSLALMHRLSSKIPGALVVTVLAIAASRLFDLEHRGVKLVGHFPGGLPLFEFPGVSWGEIHSLLPPAIGIALLTYTEAILLARAFAARNGYDVSSNQELVALGVVDVAVGLFQGFSVTGSQARTTINENSGGKTQLASIVAAVGLALALLFLAPTIAQLPQVALAAILIFAGAHLIEFQGLRQIFRFSKRSALVAVVTSFSVLAAGVVPGIVFGVVLSLVGLIHRISNPPDAVLCEVPGKGFHDLGRPSQTRTLPGLVAYRFYAPLLFSNISHFVERLREIIATGSGPVSWLLLDAQAISEMDVTAAEELQRLCRDLKHEGIELKIAHANRPLREGLQTSGLAAELGPGSFFDSVHECVEAFRKRQRLVPPGPPPRNAVPQ